MHRVWPFIVSSFINSSFTISLLVVGVHASIAIAADSPIAKKGDVQDQMVIANVQPTFFDLVATGNDGKLRPLHEFRGQVVLVTNTASRCGYTPQYDGLQKLHGQYKTKGFAVLGFPSNDFGGQEPGTDKEIKEFCKVNFNIDFPLFQKNPVTGTQKQPIYKYLTERSPKGMQGEVKWNFEKFLINRQGEVIARFPSSIAPEDKTLVAKIEELLRESTPAKPAPKGK